MSLLTTTFRGEDEQTQNTVIVSSSNTTSSHQDRRKFRWTTGERNNHSSSGGHKRVRGSSITRSSRSRSSSRNNNDEESQELLLLAIQQEHYDRLLYTAHKQIHKQAKIVRNFFIQKEIRHQKQKQQQQKPQSGETNSTKLSDRLLMLKGTDLEVVTQQALRQLGMYHSDPRRKVRFHEWNDTTDHDGTSRNDVESSVDPKLNHRDECTILLVPTKQSTTIPPPPLPPLLSSDDPYYNIIMTDILTHTRLVQTMEEWNTKLTKYRQWCTELEADQSRSWEDYQSNRRKRNNNNKRRKKEQQQHKQQQQKEPGRNHQPKQSGHKDPNQHYSKDEIGLLHATSQDPSSMFCTLSGESTVPAETMRNDEDGRLMKQQKKNRMGQRARKAKAMAIQAKQEGRTDFQSLNWRAPKPNHSNADDDDNRRPPVSEKKERTMLKREKQPAALFGKTPKGNSIKVENAAAVHPSWAAKQAQSTGIVAFQGKKITFDSN